MGQPSSRRSFLQKSLLGLGVATAAGLRLRVDAQPTESSGNLGTYGDYLAAQGESAEQAPAPKRPAAAERPVTEPNIKGPFHREGAPYRAKITPPLEPGSTLLIQGVVWGFDTQQPLPRVTLDIWQANADGRYDNDAPSRPPADDVFLNRARVLTDELGRYEYETISPGPYKTSPNTWRPPHIHYLVRAAGYQTLITQLYFRGDPHQTRDPFIRESLIIGLDAHQRGDATYRSGTFDVVLAPK